jgi:hypothetical protein
MLIALSPTTLLSWPRSHGLTQTVFTSFHKFFSPRQINKWRFELRWQSLNKIHNFRFNLSKMSLHIAGSTCSCFLDSGKHDLTHTVFTSFFLVKSTRQLFTWRWKFEFRWQPSDFTGNFHTKIEKQTWHGLEAMILHTLLSQFFFLGKSTSFSRQIKVSVMNLTVKIWSFMTNPRI